MVSDLTAAHDHLSEPATKERILDAAEELFANLGYKGASVKKISAEAGVTGAMINYYFSGKENLYNAVLDRIMTDIGKMVQDILATGKPPVERLEIFIGWYFDYASEHPNFSKLTRMAMSGPGRGRFEKIMKDFFRPMFEVGVSFFENELPVNKRVWKSLDTRHFLLAIYGMTISYFTDVEFVGLILDADPLAKKELAARKDALIEIIFRTLGLTRPSVKANTRTGMRASSKK